MSISDFLIVLVTVIAFFLALLLIMNISAQNAYESSKQYEKEYRDLIISIQNYRREIAKYKPCLHSPPRAFLYTQTDKEINTAYKNVQKELEESIRSFSRIDKIDAPNGGVKGFFELSQLRSAIGRHKENTRKIYQLRKHLENIQLEKNSIEDAIYEQEQIKKKIKKDITKQKDTIKTQRLELITKESSVGINDYNRVKLHIDFAQEDLESLIFLTSQDKPTTDLGFAHAFVVLMGIEVLLLLFAVDKETLEISDVYKLDITRSHIDALVRQVTDARIFIGNDTFESLKIKANKWNSLAEDIGKAKTTFIQFQEDCLHYESRRNELCNLRLDFILQSAQKVEDEWREYWGTPVESIDAWEPLLNGKPIPSEQLQFIIHTVKKICSGGITNVRQSSLQNIIEALDGIFSDIDNTKNTIQSIRNQVDIHKKAEDQVKEKIKRYGSSEIIYENMVSLKDKDLCSDTIAEKIKSLEERYLALCNRSKVKKQANYPNILHKLSKFETSANEVINEHNNELKALRNKISEYSRQIGEYKNQFLAISTKFPTEDLTWNEIIKIFDDINTKYSDTSDSYKKMKNYEKSAEDVIKLLRKEKTKIDLAIKKAEKNRIDLKEKINDAEKEAERMVNQALETKWKKPLKHKLDTLSKYLEKYKELAQKNDVVSNGALKTIPKEITEIREEMLGLNGEIYEQLGIFNGNEKKLNDALNTLQSSLGRAVDRGISDNLQKEINKLINDAMNTYSIESALDILRREAIEKLGKPTVEFIGEKTDVFTNGGSYVNGDVKTGGDFIGRDKNK